MTRSAHSSPQLARTSNLKATLAHVNELLDVDTPAHLPARSRMIPLIALRSALLEQLAAHISSV
jgi:hypothetical protein